ncbi:tetratricopeptide repeat protein [Calditrichota bacterium LG25]
MLKPQKKKITKKALKEDKFVEAALNAKTYLEENSKQVMIVVGVVLALIILIILYRDHQQTRDLKAATLLGLAQVEYQNMNYAKARQFLNQLLEDYDGTDAAEQGYFVLANLNYQQGKYEEAEAAFKKFIDSYDGSKILKASGLAGYAACLEHRGAHQEAAEYYLKAQKTAPDFVEAANYLYLAGRNFLKAGQKDKAKKAFETVIKKYEKSNRANDAKAQLIIMAEEK